MNKNLAIFLIVFFAVLAGSFAFKLYYPLGEPSEETVSSFDECLEAGYLILESYPRQCKTPDGRTFTEYIGNELEKTDLILITDPRPNQIIESPLLVKGAARGSWFFEADFPARLYDDNGFLLGVRPARALEDWMTENFVPFETTFPFAVPSTPKGLLILEKDNPSGLPENDDQLIMPVDFSEISEAPEELMTVTIFLSDSNFIGEPNFDCSRTVVVERQVAKTEGVARASLEALFRGATKEETDQGYISSINPGVRIQSLTIEEGTAKVDFTEQLEYQVGGSCLVTAIRVQIIDTLLQFPTVDDVVISIDGRTEDILQP